MTIPHIKDNAPEDLTIISIGDSLYQYARVISNTRFGHMPSSIAYCKNATHVQYCINYCSTYQHPFRVRSGGHQHEGMSSGNRVIIIDLSEMDTIDYVNNDEAWVPVGKQLGKVYEELEERGRIIPGGGCQSVNVGGLTHGGGWGLSIRKYGMTCDSVLECEIVLADGTIAYPSPSTMKDLFKGLKGGGGGNFGVVTRFKFKLSSLEKVTTSFSILWEDSKKAIKALKIWTFLHEVPHNLNTNLSTACGLMVADPKTTELPKGHVSAVHGRMGGLFYGTKEDLWHLLRTHFGKELIPEIKDFNASEKYHNQTRRTLGANTDKTKISLAKHQSYVSDFANPTVSIQNTTSILEPCGDRNYRILPDAPSSTCDRPHPHKVTSGFPKATSEIEHHQLVDAIYEYLGRTCFYTDVNRYMSFHCLGGAVTKNPEQRIFAFHDKPYMLQIQCWWDDAGNTFTNVARNKEYVEWVKNFRENLSKKIEGAFINFVDRSLVEHPETPEGRIELLKIYYGEENLNYLHEVKSTYDRHNVFDFEMSIPLP